MATRDVLTDQAAKRDPDYVGGGHTFVVEHRDEALSKTLEGGRLLLLRRSAVPWKIDPKQPKPMCECADVVIERATVGERGVKQENTGPLAVGSVGQATGLAHLVGGRAHEETDSCAVMMGTSTNACKNSAHPMPRVSTMLFASNHPRKPASNTPGN